MKNKISLLVIALSAGASIVFAGVNVQSRGSFSALGNTAITTIPASSGASIRDVTLSASVESNKTLTVYRPRYTTETAAAIANSTTATVYCPSASNTVSGFSPTTSDFLLVRTEGTQGYQLRQISSISSYNTTTKVQTYVLASAVTAADGDPVYVVDATDNVAIPLTTGSAVIPYRYMFTGFTGQPVTLSLAAGAGASSSISGTYDIEK